jgi:hypothetical protein
LNIPGKLKVGALDILEFGFYCSKLKQAVPLNKLHRIYKKNKKGSRDVFKKLYEQHFPDGETYEEWLEANAEDRAEG